MTSQRVVALMYHSILPDPLPSSADRYHFSVSVALFEGQMALLRKWGFLSISLAELRLWIDGQLSLSGPRVLITFDDGYRSVLEHAATVLVQHSLGGTVFLVPAYAGQWNVWDNPQSAFRLATLGWQQVRCLLQLGFEVGSHSLTHLPLSGLDAMSQRTEIVTSKMRIESELGIRIRAFAYPHSQYDSLTPKLISRAGYDLAFCGWPAAITRRSKRTALPRICVYGHETLAQFAAKVRMGVDLGELARHLTRMAWRSTR